ncbi:hypothetical protein FRAHR75_770014 [Frankia sp. Hr75.2]|nr:hypothetical protein FRAHR75_770014 [Frankia sp. Hr75.2]
MILPGTDLRAALAGALVDVAHALLSPDLDISGPPATDGDILGSLSAVAQPTGLTPADRREIVTATAADIYRRTT